MCNMFTQAIGYGVRSTIISTARQGIFLIPALLIFPRVFGLLGIQIAQPVADICTLVLCIAMMSAGFCASSKPAKRTRAEPDPLSKFCKAFIQKTRLSTLIQIAQESKLSISGYGALPHRPTIALSGRPLETFGRKYLALFLNIRFGLTAFSFLRVKPHRETRVTPYPTYPISVLSVASAPSTWLRS